MGMDLIPMNPAPNAPRYNAPEETWHGRIIYGRYNWSGWKWLYDHLVAWGVNVSEFSGTNDGDEISAETCCEVADAIEEHIDELGDQDQAWLRPHIMLWRTCGGYKQL